MQNINQINKRLDSFEYSFDNFGSIHSKIDNLILSVDSINENIDN